MKVVIGPKLNGFNVPSKILIELIKINSECVSIENCDEDKYKTCR